MLDKLTYDDFKDYRGKTFMLEGIGGQVEMRLLDVRRSPYSGLPTQRQPFAILFVAPDKPALAGKMYNIRHPGRGLVEGMFISPVLPPPQFLQETREMRFYEAIFN
ncbi:MAG: hypothetical protein JJU21_14415 [Salinarimonas sp.]|nr:hypothetical protein [Salinarimonas sp.]